VRDLREAEHRLRCAEQERPPSTRLLAAARGLAEANGRRCTGSSTCSARSRSEPRAGELLEIIVGDGLEQRPLYPAMVFSYFSPFFRPRGRAASVNCESFRFRQPEVMEILLNSAPH